MWWLVLCTVAVAAISSDHLYDRFILDGREDDYLLLESDGTQADSAEDGDHEDDPDEQLRPVFAGRDHLYDDEDEEHDEFDRVEEADIVLHSPWAPRYEAAEDAYEPRCPPPEAMGSDCGAPACASDRDCRAAGADKLCCHNGCVRTCAEPAPPPIEIDWVDRTSSIYDTVSRDPSLRIKSSSPQHAALSPQMVTMKGGCVLSLKQFRDLAGFSKNDNINGCFCEKGGVFCEVAHTSPAKN